jgi:cytidine deaminase
MQHKHLSVPFTEYDSPAELPEADQELLMQAKKALVSAYAPYSKYQVGAAVSLENGSVYTGNNQENMAFPSGLCAERVALYAAAASNPGIAVRAIAITAHSESFPVIEPVPPCGSCRQSMIEYEMLSHQRIRVILMGESGKVIVIDGIDRLLPLSFREDGLKK